jgi:hypothetical protein
MSQPNEPSGDEQSSRSGPASPSKRTSPVPLIILAGVAILIAVVAAAILLATDEEAVSGFEAANGELLVPGLSQRVGEVSRIEIERYHGSLTLTRSGDDWHLAERDGFRARRDAVDALISDVAHLSAAYVSSGSDLSPADYDVVDPEDAGGSVRVRLLDDAGNEMTSLIIGHTFSPPTAPHSTNVFARRDGSARIWIAEGELDIPVLPTGWIDRDVVDIPRGSVVEFRTAPPDGEPVTIRRADDEFTSPQTAEDETGTASWALDNVIGVLEEVRLEDVRSSDSLPSDVEHAGTATVVTSEGLEYRIDILMDGPTVWTAFSAAADGATGGSAKRARSFNDRHEGWVYKLPRLVTTRLMTPADEINQLTPE